MRVFVAVPTPKALQARLSALQSRLRPRLGGIRLLRPESIHLTLRFLGDASVEQARELEHRLRAAAAACPRVGISTWWLAGREPARCGWPWSTAWRGVACVARSG